MIEVADLECGPKRIWGLSFRALCALVLSLLLLACGIGVRVSPMTGHVRVLLVVTLLFSLFTALVFLFSAIGRRPTTVWPAVFFIVLFVVWGVMGSKPPDTDALREVYYKRLHAFIGTPYARGGETDVGIDSAGLARAALWHAMVREGVKEFNPRLLGSKLWSFWWHDVSARDIDGGKYGYTQVIGHAPKLAGYDTSKVKIGDMAVADKSHVIVYYGKGQWIEANPVDGKVVVNKAPASSKRPRFNEPVRLIRWRIFEEQ
jgi:hypothetical protein